MRSRATQLWGLGLLLCVSALTLLYLSVPPGFPQPFFWAPRRNHSFEVSALYRQGFNLPHLSTPRPLFRWLNLSLVALSFGCYVGAVRTAGKHTWRWPLGATTSLLVLVVLAMPPLFATDLFYYAIIGQIAAQFGANPYIQPPAHFPQSALLPYNYWVDITSSYGPVWTMLASIISGITGSDPLVASLGYKLVAAVLVLVTAWMIWTILCETAPEFAAQGTILFLWNPVVLLETVGNAHNDIAMAALTCCAALLLYRRRYTLGFVALVLATLLKYLVAPLLAFYFVARVHAQPPLLRAKLKTAAGLLALAVTITVIVWIPYWEGPRTFAGIAGEPTRGLSGFISTIIRTATRLLPLSNDARRTLALSVSLVALFTTLVWILGRLLLIWRRGQLNFLNELTPWAWTMLLIPITLPRAHIWYLVPALALFAMLLPYARKGILLCYFLTAGWFFFRICVW